MRLKRGDADGFPGAAKKAGGRPVASDRPGGELTRVGGAVTCVDGLLGDRVVSAGFGSAIFALVM